MWNQEKLWLFYVMFVENDNVLSATETFAFIETNDYTSK